MAICPYSPSCFTCPMADCKVDGSSINPLPSIYRKSPDKPDKTETEEKGAE